MRAGVMLTAPETLMHVLLFALALAARAPDTSTAPHPGVTVPRVNDAHRTPPPLASGDLTGTVRDSASGLWTRASSTRWS